MRTTTVYLLLALFALPVFSQKVKTVEGKFVYHVPETESLASAKKHALKVARLHAIAAEFGTIVAQTNVTRMQNTNGQSMTHFSSYGSSDVKGEWIETIGKPEFHVEYIDETLIVTCEVKGKAREIVYTQANFQAKVLRNGTDDASESYQFVHGNHLYLSFQSPQKGYLAVYIADDKDHVQCLLPYRKQQDGIYQVEANRRYVFFSKEDAPGDMVDECIAYTNRSSEENQVYVIFSPNQFVKAADAASGRVTERQGISGFPRELSYEDFHKWLAKCRRLDSEMSMKKILITIKK